MAMASVLWQNKRQRHSAQLDGVAKLEQMNPCGIHNRWVKNQEAVINFCSHGRFGAAVSAGVTRTRPEPKSPIAHR